MYGNSDRHDNVLFKYGDHTEVCDIQAVFAHYNSSFSAKFRLALIRLMDEIDTYIVNTSVTHAFSHRRFKYAVSSTSFIRTVLVHASTFLQPVMFVVDPYCLQQNYGTYKGSRTSWTTRIPKQQSAFLKSMGLIFLNEPSKRAV